MAEAHFSQSWRKNMKVSQTTEISASEKTPNARRTDKAGEDFTRVFQEELNQTKEASKAVSNEILLTPLQSAVQIPFAVLNSAQMHDASPVETAIDATLEQLERVSQLLHNPAVSSRKVDDAITLLSAEASKLQNDVDGLPGDHPLRQIATETSILATVESMKWKRGDYL
jgi:hypothetical protein